MKVLRWMEVSVLVSLNPKMGCRNGKDVPIVPCSVWQRKRTHGIVGGYITLVWCIWTVKNGAFITRVSTNLEDQVLGWPNVAMVNYKSFEGAILDCIFNREPKGKVVMLGLGDDPCRWKEWNVLSRCMKFMDQDMTMLSICVCCSNERSMSSQQACSSTNLLIHIEVTV